ncbi:MAG: PD40 domain-containing protein [Chloroflexi bacterium]|nr:PD40 domain-containing protein [Chloroflexota bacterium]
MPQPRSSWSSPPDPAAGGWPASGADPWQGDSATTGWATPVSPPPGSGGGWSAPADPGTNAWATPPADPGTNAWAPRGGPDPGTGSNTWAARPGDPGTNAWAPRGGPDPGTGSNTWAQPPADPGTGGWPAPPTQPAGTAWSTPSQQPGGWPMPPTGGTVDPGWQATGSSSWQSPSAAPHGSPVAPGGAPPRRGRGDRRPSPPLLAPFVALLGLMVAAGGTVFAAQSFGLVGGAAAGPTATADVTAPPFETDDPFATDDPSATAGPPATPTPAPTAFVTPPPNEQAAITGTLLYTRGGQIWAVSGTQSNRITGSGTDYMPVWSPDGRRIYFVQRTLQRGKTAPWGKGTSRADTVTHLATDVMAIRADGSDRTRLLQSMQRTGQGQWSTVAIQPDIAPSGDTFVLASDFGYVPFADYDYGPVVLATMTSRGRNLKTLGIESAKGAGGKDLGHNDPDWSPDGRFVAFTYNNRAGGQGAGVPRIGIVRAPFRNKSPNLSPRNRGYANPDWSPDGKYLAVERVTTDRRDIVILDPSNWEEVGRLTTDGRSFAPVWSPNGDQIAYLHANGTKIDVRVMTLEQGATGPTLRLDQAVTVDGGVDPDSPPAWFIPQDQRTNLPTLVPEDPDATEPAADEATPEP